MPVPPPSPAMTTSIVGSPDSMAASRASRLSSAGFPSFAHIALEGVPDALVDRFRPYLGLSRGAAVVALLHAPLQISVVECAALDEAVHSDYIRRAAEAYDRAAGFRFEDIPAEAQTVIVSLPQNDHLIASRCQKPGQPKTNKACAAEDDCLHGRTA